MGEFHHSSAERSLWEVLHGRRTWRGGLDRSADRDRYHRDAVRPADQPAQSPHKHVIVAYVGWHSSVVPRTHAFMTNQAIDHPQRTHYEAACMLSMPTDAVMRWRKGVPC